MAVLPGSSAGIGSAVVDIGEVRGAGWHAQGVSLQLSLTGEPAAARVLVDRLALDGVPQPFQKLLIVCQGPHTGTPELSCRDARISGQLGPLGRQELRADVAFNTVDRSLRFQIRNLKVGGGSAAIEGSWLTAGWQLAVQTKDAQLKGLRALAAPWFKIPDTFTVEGRASLALKLRGGESIEHIEANGELAGLTASNAESTVATDQLGLKVNAQLQATAQGWRIAATFQSAAGQAYFDPIFVDLAQFPFKGTLAGSWIAQTSRLVIDKLDMDNTGVARGNATGQLAFDAPAVLKELNLSLESLEFPGAYTVLVQPFLVAGDFKDLATKGRLSGTVRIVDNAPAALDLTLQDVTALDKAGKVGIEGLRGHLVWQSATPGATAPETSASHLTWDAANAYGLAGSGARLDFAAAGAAFRLLKPAFIPVLDGGLSIQTLSVQNIGTEQMSLRFEGDLRPISLRLLSRAFDWPEFAGTLSGRIPEVRYNKGVLSFGGALEADVFNGRLTVDGLELRQPLGSYPRLKADIVFRNLDLEAVTGTFSFGSITGRLNGELRNLELFQWEPIRMDARLYTPPDDDSKHLISQRAVNNLSQIGGGGGGVAAALQGGVLRFFENFHYKRLGLSCRLENDICRMSGVAPAPNGGYYIVQGSGIPRIDIIGNAREVDWSQLVGQLQAIQTSGAPVVR